MKRLIAFKRVSAQLKRTTFKRVSNAVFFSRVNNRIKYQIFLLWRHPDVVNDAICRQMMSYDALYDVIWRNDRHMTKHIFFWIFFQNFLFYDQISLFVLFNTFLWVENAFFIFDFYFRSWKFELKGNSTSVWSKKSLCMEKVSNSFIQPENPFLQVYSVRPSK